MLPAGPATSPILNMVRWLRTPLPMLDQLARDYGHTFTLRLPRLGPMVFFAEPAAIRDLWTGDPHVLRAGESNLILRAVLGENSLLVLDGDRHIRERRLMLPAFHGERMRAYGEAMRDATTRSLDTWPVGRAFPVHEQMQAITLDVIMRTIFGVNDLGSLRDALVRWAQLGTSRVGTTLMLATPPQHARKVHDLARRGLGKLLPWAPLMRSHDEVDREIRSVLAARRREGTAGRTDVLSMLLDARDEAGAGLTDDQLRDEMLTLLVAGHETTATTLAWTLHHLLAQPKLLAAVQGEVREVAAGGPILPEHVERFVLLDAAIKETLRLTPILPLVGRRLGEATTIGGVDLPAGATAVGAIYLVHHRADLWPDPERYDPSRFVGKRIDPTHYFPFGGGARRCIGMAFANYEMKIVLATILARAELAPAPGKVKLVRRGITFAPSGGMPIIVTRRAGTSASRPSP